MATYDSTRAEVVENLQASIGGYLAGQILNALNQDGQGQSPSLGIQTEWRPGDFVTDGTSILIAQPGSVSGNVTIPDGVSALLLTGSSGVQATFNVIDDLVVELTPGEDVIRFTGPSAAGGEIETISVNLGGGDDLFLGASNAQNNVILGEGNDTALGGNLSDNFDVGQGNDYVDAGGGYDLAFVRGSIADFTSSYEGGVLTLTNNLTGDVSVLKDLEYVTFEGGGVIINVTSEAGFAAAALYETVLARSADSEGHAFYSQLAGTDLISVAEGLLNSDEFASNNGGLTASEMTDAQFLDVMYENSFDRDADPEGQAFWLDKLATGTSKGEVAVRFAYSAEEMAKFEGSINFDQDNIA